MVPPRPGEFPRRKGKSLIVGTVEYYFDLDGSYSHGAFLITDQMLDELRALMLHSEKELGKGF